MPHSLNKSIEAQRLNPRTMTVLPGHDVTVPFGAPLEGIERDGSMARFRYLGEPYSCPYERLASALDEGAFTAERPAPAPKEAAAAKSADGPRVLWQTLASSGLALKRAKVPGGWLVAAEGGGIAFYPDAGHRWDGGSLPDTAE